MITYEANEICGSHFDDSFVNEQPVECLLRLHDSGFEPATIEYGGRFRRRYSLDNERVQGDNLLGGNEDNSPWLVALHLALHRGQLARVGEIAQGFSITIKG